MATAVLTADTGAFALTGYSIQLSQTGSFALTGIAAVLHLGFTMAAGVGSFELNRESAGFGSFVSSVPLTTLLVQRTDDRYVGASGSFITLDTLEGAAFDRSINPQFMVTRGAMIENLNPNDDMDTGLIFRTALNDLTDITGDIGVSYPGFALPTYIEKFTPELCDQHTVKMKILYRSYPVPEFDFDTSLGQIDTNVEDDGTPIQVSYTYPDDYKLDSRKAGLTINQGGVVSMPISETLITVSFTITSGYLPTLTVGGVPVFAPGVLSASTILTNLELLAGRVNDATYFVGNIGGAARTWMVERVKGKSRDGGRTFQTSISLRFKPQGIETQVTYINSDSGHPPADLVAGTGYYKPEVLGTCEIPDWLFSNPNFWTVGDDWTWV